jgi:lipid-A-disaccharide synthase
LLDTVGTTGTRKEFLHRHDIPEKARCIGLLPGSRSKEVSALLPVFLKSAEKLQEKTGERFTWLIPLASTISEREMFEQGIGDYADRLDIRVIKGDRYDLMAACETVVAASGTVTLELALLGVPMIVTYKVAPLTYYLGRLLVKIKYFSLVNLIAEKQVVPELLQNQVCPEAIAGLLFDLTNDLPQRAAMLEGLTEVRKRLGTAGASTRAADLALKMLGAEVQ